MTFVPHFDWAVATDGFLGAIVGGVVTGTAIFVTIRHDRRARSEDRSHQAAKALLDVCTRFEECLGAEERQRPWIARQLGLNNRADATALLLDFTHAHVLFLARLGPRDRRAKAILRELFDNHCRPLIAAAAKKPGGSPEGDEAANAIASYDAVVTMWIRRPGKLRRREVTAASVRKGSWPSDRRWLRG